jgi:hypothetical protein
MNIDETLNQELKSIIKIDLSCKKGQLNQDQIDAFNRIWHEIAKIIIHLPDYVEFSFEVENSPDFMPNKLEAKK